MDIHDDGIKNIFKRKNGIGYSYFVRDCNIFMNGLDKNGIFSEDGDILKDINYKDIVNITVIDKENECHVIVSLSYDNQVSLRKPRKVWILCKNCIVHDFSLVLYKDFVEDRGDFFRKKSVYHKNILSLLPKFTNSIKYKLFIPYYRKESMEINYEVYNSYIGSINYYLITDFSIPSDKIRYIQYK